jgi:hypothetical protein
LQRGRRRGVAACRRSWAYRFEYYRILGWISDGKEPVARLAEMQDLYDTYFSDSREWDAARANRD